MCVGEHEALLMRKREGLQKNSVNHREHGRRKADAERQCEDHEQYEPGVRRCWRSVKRRSWMKSLTRVSSRLRE